MHTKTKAYFGKTYGEKPPQNYERYFVPTIGEPIAKDLIGKIKLRPGMRVLDVACGIGIIARLALREVGGNGTVTGLDINPGMLSVARSITKHSPIHWVEASAEEMPFPDASFDVVTCQMGLQFMQNKTAALREMHRVLTPNGHLYYNLPGPAGNVFAILAEAMEQNIGPKAKEFVTNVFSLHNPDQIKKLTKNVNFRNIDINTTSKTLALPPPKDFLWQYIHSTPLSPVLSEADEEARTKLENDVVKQWENFVDDGAFIYEQRIITVTARK